MISIISKKILGNHSRTIKARKNIIASLAIKGVSILIGFLLIRVTLDYLTNVEYGIWVTLTSFLTWFTFFEIGLGNGMKNKLAESLAKQDYELAKIYVSTTYAILTLIILVVSVVFILLNNFIPWASILNTTDVDSAALSRIALIVFSFFFLRFVLKLIGTVLTADQKPAIANAFGPVGNLIKLILIYILTLTTSGSLEYLAWVISIVPTVVLVLVSVYFFRKDYKAIRPSISHVKMEYVSDLMNLGFKFFFIQISALVIFQSSNILIAQYFGPEEVTPYNIGFKLFSFINMIFAIIVSPYWSAFTEAWVKKDLSWIRNSVRTLFYIWLSMVGASLILLLLSDTIFDFWLGKDKMETIDITLKLRVSLLLYFLLFAFGSVFNMFINGIGKIKVQLISLVIGALLFIPLSMFFINHLNMGIEGIVYASILANFYSPFVAPIQYYKLINNKANGIWDK